MQKDWLKQYGVPLSAGIFIGVALFDGIPHSYAELGTYAFFWIAAGIIFWWAQKKLLHALRQPSLPYLTASALWLHSTIEGLVTGLAFGVSQTFGIAVAIGMILHLLPEFFAAFAIMKGSGSKTSQSVVTPFIGYAVLFIVFGITYYFLPQFKTVSPILGAIAAGAFIYVGYRVMRKRFSVLAITMALLGILLSALAALLL